MASRIQTLLASAEPLPGEKAGLQASWGERAVIAIAVSIGVAVVAFIAVLMGMA